jgi:hypothetical protein
MSKRRILRAGPVAGTSSLVSAFLPELAGRPRRGAITGEDRCVGFVGVVVGGWRGSVGGPAWFGVVFGQVGTHLGEEDPGGGGIWWFFGVVGFALGVTGGVGGG